MHRFLGAALGFAGLLSATVAASTPADASILIKVSRASQRMSVQVDGEALYTWRVSTGRGVYGTPGGSYRPQTLARRWFSSKYHNAPMPYSIFFHRGYAIHGTSSISQLGGRASHGCVRLHPSNAATLFRLVQREGMDNTRIVIN